MKDSAQRWIEAGYELFADEGFEGLHVETLAKKLRLNKSGFYHHFGDREVFISKILEYHYILTEKVRIDISALTKFDPDYFDLLVRNRKMLFVQMHLRRHPELNNFQQVFLKVAAMNDKAIAPLLSAHLGMPGEHDLALEVWDLVRDSFYMQLTHDNLSMELPRRIVEVARSLITKLQQRNNKSSLNKGSI